MYIMADVKINKVSDLCRKRGWDRKRFIKEAEYHAGISRPTAEKAYDGETDLSMDTVIALAKMFKVDFDEVMEIRV